MERPQLSAADRERLEQHFDAIRDAEVTMGNMADQVACSTRRPRHDPARCIAEAVWHFRPTA